MEEAIKWFTGLIGSAFVLWVAGRLLKSFHRRLPKWLRETLQWMDMRIIQLQWSREAKVNIPDQQTIALQEFPPDRPLSRGATRVELVSPPVQNWFGSAQDVEELELIRQQVLNGTDPVERRTLSVVGFTHIRDNHPQGKMSLTVCDSSSYATEVLERVLRHEPLSRDGDFIGRLRTAPLSHTGVRLNVITKNGEFMVTRRGQAVDASRGYWSVGIGEYAKRGDKDGFDFFHGIAERTLGEELALVIGKDFDPKLLSIASVAFSLTSAAVFGVGYVITKLTAQEILERHKLADDKTENETLCFLEISENNIIKVIEEFLLPTNTDGSYMTLAELARCRPHIESLL